VALSARFAAQLAHPRGFAGRLLGRVMDFANERPLRLAIEALEPKAGERILDAGCGTGAALLAIQRQADCRLYGLDRSAAMIAAARNRLGNRAMLAQGEIRHVPGMWPPFDAVLALNVLYFADSKGEMIAGLRRALRPGGRLVAYVSDRQTMERWPFTRAGHHKLFDARELEDLLALGGFSRTSISIKDHAVAPGIRGLVAHAER
jgi:SAM-dependent methyltransferase